VAVIDSGVFGDHLDLRDGGRKRVVRSVDFIKSGPADDPFGHGTHVAGIIAGDGSASAQSGEDYTGMAPGAHVVSLRVLDDMGRGRISHVIAAVDFAIANRQPYNIRIVNLSLAAPPVDSFKDDPLCQAVERAFLAGLVVATAAGNFGVNPYGRPVYGAITSPGICPAAITVGAADTLRTDARSDDRVAAYSSRGPTRSRGLNPATGQPIHDHLAKPDLLAPGSAIVSLERPQNTIVRYFPHLHAETRGDNPRARYMRLSGSSMATGVVSGAAALVLQANPALTPNLVRALLMYSAQILEGEDLFEQGAGLLNVEGAMRIAGALRLDADPTVAKLPPSLFPKPASRIAGETVPWSQGSPSRTACCSATTCRWAVSPGWAT
jgi:subtilisin family serine protease